MNLKDSSKMKTNKWIIGFCLLIIIILGFIFYAEQRAAIISNPTIMEAWSI
jgi:hypothetical protein